MECDPTRVCERLVGLGDVEVLGVDDEAGEPLGVHVRRRVPRPDCVGCGGWLWSNGERLVELVDLPAFGRPVRLVWHKRRWRCGQRGCLSGTVTEQDPAIAPPRERLTTRAGRWATRQAGRGRPLKEVASELGCSWHPVNMSVSRWGEALLAADTARIGDTRALGLDEHLMWRRGRFRTKAWATSIVDVGRGQLLDVVRGRTAKAPTKWLLERPRAWRCAIGWAVLELSGPYRAAFDAALPAAKQVADPFHVVRLGNDALDEVRRRVQNQTLGHRGHKHDPLYRARKLLVSVGLRHPTQTQETQCRTLMGPVRICGIWGCWHRLAGHVSRSPRAWKLVGLVNPWAVRRRTWRRIVPSILPLLGWLVWCQARIWSDQLMMVLTMLWNSGSSPVW